MCAKFFRSIGSLFSPPKVDVPVFTPPPAEVTEAIETPDASDEEVKAKKEEQRKRAAAAKGRSSTILTGYRMQPQDDTGGRKTLLGA